MNFLRRPQRKLSTTLSVLVTSALLLVLFALGLYFDQFLRANFLDITAQRMQHGYERLAYNLGQIETGLQEGAAFAKTDERILASVDLINRYQNKVAYNTFLIDEEKKSLATAMLDRVKLSMNSDLALYGKDEELIAYATRHGDGYQLGYLSYATGDAEIHLRQENEAEYRVGTIPVGVNVSMVHQPTYPEESLKKGGVVTYQKLGMQLSITSHQRVSDPHGDQSVGHIEITRNLDAAYFARISSEMDLNLGYSFSSDAAAPGNFDSKPDRAALRIAEVGDSYVGVMQKDVLGGKVYFTATVDRASHVAVLNTHRTRFLVLMVLVGGLALWSMRVVVQRRLAQPLRTLMQQIQKVERGDYAPSALVGTGDELEAISSSVNALAAAVNDRELSLEHARSEQEHLSHHDSLTGLPNRRFFSQRLEHALDLARRNRTELALFFMDLDQFKLINDTLGHDVGDELLVQIGERLKTNARSSDTLARIGGDEFNVLIENVRDRSEVEIILGKYLALFYQPFTCGIHELSITVSIGAAIFPKDGTDSVSLLKHADLAVYRSKERGRDNYSFFSEELAERANLQAETINALKNALLTCDEFAMYYQPKVQASTGKVVSAEALIRWVRPGHGVVPPMQFIPIAEDTGLIIELGDWVIGRCCEDLARMEATGVHLQHLSLNVSNVQLRGHALLPVLKSAIEANRLQTGQIELEITESFIAKDMAQAIVTLNEFRALGLQLAIDDFGTGYSSMRYLQKLPFTRMKVDKSFIDRLPDDQDSVAITRAILGLARSFGLAVTAEGIENARQLEFLQQEGCDEIQGYYFAKPMPLAEFMAFCRNNQSVPAAQSSHASLEDQGI